MDLITLWEHAPPLLAACISDDTPGFRNLRLVSKEASRVALLGLRFYKLTLNGVAGDTDIRGASLLRRTRLEELELFLNSSCGWVAGTALLQKLWGTG